MRHNRTQAEIGESFGNHQPRDLGNNPILAQDLAGYVPRADELDADTQ